MTTTTRFATTVALLAVLTIACGPALADVVTFDNENGNRQWSEGPNWDTDAVPGLLDDAVVPNTSGGNVEIAADVGTVNSLRIGGGGGEQVDLLANGALVVQTNILLGIVEGIDNRGGEIRPNNNSASLTINGDIVANSPGDNDVTFNRGTFNLAGDIVMTGDNRIDRFSFQRGTFNLTGVGAQTMTVQQFDLAESGANNLTATLTLAADKTLVTTNFGDTNEVGRMTNNSNRSLSGTLNIHGGAANYAGHLRVGSVDDPSNAPQDAEGIVNVGDGLGAGGTLTVDRELRMGYGPDGGDAGEMTTGDLNVLDAGASATINSSILLTRETSGSDSLATITIDAGLLKQTSGDIVNGGGVATLNLAGGVLDLAAANSTTRGVDTFNFDGGQLKLLIYPDLPALVTTDTTLAAAPGGSEIDVLALPDSAGSVIEQAVWDGGTAEWDGDAMKWNPDTLPANLVSIQTNDEFTIVSSANAITNQGNAMLSAAADVDWDLDQTSATEIKVTRTGPAVELGPGKAVIDNASSIVSRTTDLNIQNAGGVGADASQLEISDGSLTLSGSNHLILGGAEQGIVNQDGGAVTIGGILEFGQAADDNGGEFNLNGGSLTINGVDANGNSIVEVDPTVNAAAVQINAGTLSVAGNILAQRFSVGQDATSDGASYTIAAGKIVETTGQTEVANAGTNAVLNVLGTLIADTVIVADEADSSGEVNITGGTVQADTVTVADAAGSVGEVNIDGGTVQVTGGEFQVVSAEGASGAINITGNPTITVTGGNFEVAEAGTGVFQMDSGTLFQNSNNFIWGQGTTSDATVTLTGGMIDLRGDAGQNLGDSGHFRVNRGEGGDGTNTADLLGGTVITGVGGDLSMTNNANGVGVLTIDGATVIVGDDVEYRDNGTDTILLKSGLLDLTAGEFHMADRSGTNLFTWTGGEMKDVSTFHGDLMQGNADAASLLQIGASPGAMEVTGSYELSAAAGDNTSTLVLELFGPNTDGSAVAGVDFDQLTVVGPADLFGTIQVLDLSEGAINTIAENSWDMVVADMINTGTVWDLPEGFFSRVVSDANGGTNDVLQIYTMVPEPSSLVLLVCGLAALGRRRRRRAA